MMKAPIRFLMMYLVRIIICLVEDKQSKMFLAFKSGR